MNPRRVTRIGHTMIFSLAGMLAMAAAAAEPPPAKTLAQQVGAEPPRAELPAIPKDGSGIYRLGILPDTGKQLVYVYLDVADGKVRRAVARSILAAPMVWPVDSSKLSVAGDKITGSFTMQVMDECGTHPERLIPGNIVKRPMAKDYRWEPLHVATITLDASCKGHEGKGTCQIDWGGKSRHVQGTDTGTVSVFREAARELPSRYDVDLHMYAALGDMIIAPIVNLRAAMENGQASRITSIVMNVFDWTQPLVMKETKLTIGDGTVRGRIEGTVKSLPDRPIALEINGEVIGRQLWGTVTLVEGASRITTSWIGTINASAAFRHPLDILEGTWKIAHTAEADSNLVAQARAESNEPVMPGDPGPGGTCAAASPGNRRFRTWRLMTREPNVSTIYPPSFGIEETPNAVSYRYTITGSKNIDLDYRDRGIRVEFTAEKPWLSLSKIWGQLEPGPYSLVVTPLDAKGNAIPGPMRMAIMEPGQPYGKDPVGWTHKEIERIGVFKRHSFSGPYFAPPERDWTQYALETSRWHAEQRLWLTIRGQKSPAMIPGAENGFAYEAGPILWTYLGLRSLSDDPEERSAAARMLPFVADMAELHQPTAQGMFYGYKGYTPLARWFAEPAIDAFLQTGDPRWRNMVMAYGRRLGELQNDDGSFGSMKGKGTAPGGGFAKWPAGNQSFGASEQLYVLGRIRRDLGTNEFLETEKRALKWMREVAMKEQFWPIYVGHSATQGYPVGQHAMSPLFYARYLLELALPEDRNLAEAESVARCAEDLSIEYARLGTLDLRAPVTPYLAAGDRCHGDPIAVQMLAAITFKHLARQTGSNLWSAKADALARAVVAARDPATGYLTPSLAPNYQSVSWTYTSFDHATSARTWAIQLMREYAAMEKSVKK